MATKLVPIEPEAMAFEEKQLRQPRTPADLPQVTDPESIEQAQLLLRLMAEVKEREGLMNGIKEALADRHLPHSGMTVQIDALVLSRYDRQGSVQWAKFAPRYLPADVNPEDFRAKTVEVVSARRA